MVKWRPQSFSLYLLIALLQPLYIGCASSIAGGKLSPPPKPKNYHRSALRLFRSLLSIDTTPQLGKKIALHRLSQELENYPPIEVYEKDLALVAHLPGQTRETILLLSHIDTISWEETQWSEDAGPISAALVEDRIVGRGALGGKGAASLMTSVLAQASTAKNLQRSIYLVVTTEGADPEARQLKRIFARYPRLATTYLALNPGGVILRESRKTAKPRYLVTHGEQGFARILVTANGFSAGTQLAKAISRAHQVLTKPSYTGSAARYLSDLAQTSSPLVRWLIGIKPLAQALYMTELENTPWTSGMVICLEHVSYWGRRHEPFVQNDARAQAWLDVSLPEAQTPVQKRAELRKALNPLVHVDLYNGEPAILDVAHDHARLPVLAEAFGHKHWLRILGAPSQARFLLGIQIPTFGFMPFEVSPQTFATRGRPREHLPTQSLYRALDVLHRALLHLTQSGAKTSPTSAVAR
ncbi:MAG: M20/M25/M40 family metallo-hydrolase [Myxococcales bacterium]|nr:M20/M25/M40 family metallo-hydrolase [Myxococcales bacterium]